MSRPGRPGTLTTLKLHAAGSLKAAMTDIAAAFEAATGVPVETAFGPSGLLRRRIEAGERPGVFASADMQHPRALVDLGLGGPVTPFARNRLCVLARPGLAVDGDGLLERMLDPAVRLGTSTPGADPSGDYAWALFGNAEEIVPGAFRALDAKALKLTGGPDSAAPPEGRNPYGWIVESGRADLFLTYRTNARLAQREVPGLRIVELPEALAVGADYGLIVLDGAPPAARKLAQLMLSPEGQGILAGYGFAGPTLSLGS